jgi:hypothetical protein
MSRLSGIHSAVAVPVGLYWHGQTVVYESKSTGFRRQITAIVIDQGSSRDEPNNHRVNDNMLRTSCRYHETLGINNPQEHDSIEYQSQTWRFLRVISQTAASIEIEWTRKTDIRPTR